MSSIPLADAPSFAPDARRTLAVRATLAALVAGAVVAAALVARDPRTATVVPLPRSADTIVVLDLSASIGSDTFSRIGATLSQLSRSRGRYGLVVFSGEAYEALPPGTPSAALKPYARYFTLPPTQNGFLPQFPVNPWTNSFSGGTRIAAGLGLALRIIKDDGVKNPAVVLVSDLDDDPGDLKNLAGVALAYRQENIPVRVVALDPQPKDQALFGRLLEQAATVQQGRLPGERAQTTGAAVPPLLAALVALVVLALAANELWGARLTWRAA